MNGKVKDFVLKTTKKKYLLKYKIRYNEFVLYIYIRKKNPKKTTTNKCTYEENKNIFDKTLKLH